MYQDIKEEISPTEAPKKLTPVTKNGYKTISSCSSLRNSFSISGDSNNQRSDEEEDCQLTLHRIERSDFIIFFMQKIKKMKNELMRLSCSSVFIIKFTFY